MKPRIQYKNIAYILGSLLAIFLIARAFSAGKEGLATRITDLEVVSQRYYAVYHVEKWTAVRKTNRSTVPSCAWNIYEDTYRVCDSYDEEGNCTSYSWETDYNYDVMAWRSFQKFEVNDSIKVFPKHVAELKEDVKHFKVRLVKEYNYVTVRSGWDTRELRHPTRVHTSHVRGKVRKKSGKILRIL